MVGHGNFKLDDKFANNLVQSDEWYGEFANNLVQSDEWYGEFANNLVQTVEWYAMDAKKTPHINCSKDVLIHQKTHQRWGGPARNQDLCFFPYIEGRRQVKEGENELKKPTTSQTKGPKTN